MELSLSLKEANALHAVIEDRLEAGQEIPELERAYRLLGWRILAARSGSGLTGRMAALAREASTLEEYESARDHELGPVIEGLERGENRDP